MNSIKENAVSGIKWSAVSQVFRQGAQVITLLILAQLLQASDFGLVAMAMVVVGFATIFRDLGTSAVVIQRDEVDDDFLASIFWLNVGLGITAAIILILVAPLVAMFFDEPAVTRVLALLSLSFAISGLSILQQALLERKLAFNRLAAIEMASVLAGAVAGIASALSGLGYWSLIIQVLVTNTLSTLLLWVLCEWKPGFTFKWNLIKAGWSYSSNIVGFNLINYFARNTDKLLIGRFLGPAALGFYNLAYRLLLYPIQNIARVIGRVMFPVLSQLKLHAGRFRRAYLKFTGGVAVITFPMMLGLLAVAEPFVLGVLGRKWEPVIVLLQIFAPVGLIQSIATTAGDIYKSKGRTDWMFRWGLLSSAVFVVAFIIGLQWGVIGVAAAYAIASLVLLVPGLYIPLKLTDFGLRQLWDAVSRPMLCSLIMLGTLLAMKYSLLQGVDNLITLAVMITSGAVVYLVSSIILNREQVREIFSLAGSVRK